MKTNRDKAAEKAASYINIKPRTRHQIVQYLKDKGFEEDVILQAVAELEEYHYIDDFDYCKQYFQYGFEKGRGLERIRRELTEKGVSSDVIQMAYDELEDVPDQEEMALSVAAPMVAGLDLESMAYDEKRKLQAKIGRRLVSKGFSSEVAYKVIRQLT